MMTSRIMKCLTLPLVAWLMSGCSVFDNDTKTTPKETTAESAKKAPAANICVSPQGQLVDCQMLQLEQAKQDAAYNADPRVMQYTHPLETSNNSVLVGDYIEQMATEILHNLTIPLSEAVVGVTSFVEFSEDLSTVNHFGNMLAENFIFELQQNGIPVVDYKVAQGVTVTSTGDYVFSRNPEHLALSTSMNYVLTGTMTFNKRGLVLNARMVHFENKRVVAASKKIIPYFVLDSIIPSSDKQIVVGAE